MGCDINEHVEQWRDGSWTYVEVPHDKRLYRDYSLFSVLAGVRKDVADQPQRFWPQRAIPDDASEELKGLYEWYTGEYPSIPMQFAHSYRTLVELLEHDWSRWPAFAELLDWMKTLGEPDDVRFVFWFSN